MHRCSRLAALACVIAMQGLLMPQHAQSLQAVPETHQAAVKVVSHGSGLNERAALLNALRGAIEQVAGVYMNSQTKVKLGAVIDDEISAVSSGFVRKYFVLRTTAKQGITEIDVEVEVSPTPVVHALADRGALRVDASSFLMAARLQDQEIQAIKQGCTILFEQLPRWTTMGSVTPKISMEENEVVIRINPLKYGTRESYFDVKAKFYNDLARLLGDKTFDSSLAKMDNLTITNYSSGWSRQDVLPLPSAIVDHIKHLFGRLRPKIVFNFKGKRQELTCNGLKYLSNNQLNLCKFPDQTLGQISYTKRAGRTSYSDHIPVKADDDEMVGFEPHTGTSIVYNFIRSLGTDIFGKIAYIKPFYITGNMEFIEFRLPRDEFENLSDISLVLDISK